MKLLAIIVVLFGSGLGFAQNHGEDHCTPWERLDGVECNFAGNGDSWSWERKCTDWKRSCTDDHRREYKPCDAENFCGPKRLDPNLMEADCTDWYEHRGVTCIDRNTGRDEQRYTRACVKGFVPTIRCGNYVLPY